MINRKGNHKTQCFCLHFNLKWLTKVELLQYGFKPWPTGLRCTSGSKYDWLSCCRNDEATSLYLWMRWAASDFASVTPIQCTNEPIPKVTHRMYSWCSTSFVQETDFTKTQQMSLAFFSQLGLSFGHQMQHTHLWLRAFVQLAVPVRPCVAEEGYVQFPHLFPTL